MGRKRMVVGSRHLALGVNELEGGARRRPKCQLALLFTSLPTLAVASRMAGVVVVVFTFGFQLVTVAPAALRVCGWGLGMSSVPNEGGTLSPCRDVRRYAPCGMGYVGRGTGMVVVVKRKLL